MAVEPGHLLRPPLVSSTIPRLSRANPLKSILFFDLADLLAERGLADAQSLRSAGEVKFLCQDRTACR
jgi:hypothetical protein